MFINLSWIPDFSYFDHKIKIPIDNDKALLFIKQKIISEEIYNSTSDLFWTLILLYQIDQLNLIDKFKVKSYILSLKINSGGYKDSDRASHANIYSTFYCLTILKLLGFENLIGENDFTFVKSLQNLESNGDGGFLHCQSNNCTINCQNASIIEASFLAVSILKLFNKFELIDKEKLIKFIIKNTNNDFSLIYNILSLDILNELDQIDLEKKLSIILSWQFTNSGFGIKSEVPSIEHIFWISICLEKIGNLNFINYSGVFNFIINMQQENGGFIDQYSNIKINEPDIESTSFALFSINLLWKRIVESIENEILLKANTSNQIDMIPISKKFSINLKLVIEIAVWLLTSKWIEGVLSHRFNNFQNYLNEQNNITKIVIKKLYDLLEQNPGQNEINLTEISKNFDFSNTLERIKIIINDLIINKFLYGELRSNKKDLFLYNPLILKEYILLNKPFTRYNEVLKEKQRIIKAKNRLLNVYPKLTNYIKKNEEDFNHLIDHERLKEAYSLIDLINQYIKARINKLEKILNQIKEDHNFIKSNPLNDKFERFWPNIREFIEKQCTSFKSMAVEKLAKTEEKIKNRDEKARNRNSVDNLKLIIKVVISELNNYKAKLDTFFAENIKDHEKILIFLKKISDFQHQKNIEIEKTISDLQSNIKFETIRDTIIEIKSEWNIERVNFDKHFKDYYAIIDNRNKFKQYISTKISTINDFLNEKKNQIIDLFKNKKLRQSSFILNEAINDFNKIFSNQNEIFYVTLDQLNREIPAFPKYTSDIKTEWIEKRENQKSEWETVILNLQDEINTAKKYDKKNQLQQIIDDKTKDIYDLIENMNDIILKLIDSKNLSDAEKKLNVFYENATQKLKTMGEEFKEFIKTSKIEFKEFRVLTKDLIEEWEVERDYLTRLLNEIIDGLKIKIEESSSQEKKLELYFLIKTYISDIEDKLNDFKLKFNNIIDSGKKIIDFELEFDRDIGFLKTSLKSYDNQINSFIKTSARIFETFNQIIEEDLDFWNRSKANLLRNIENVVEKINTDIFIEKIQSLIAAFINKEIDVSYLAKMVKEKSDSLKLKLISLISNSKLKGELDSNGSKFILREEYFPEKFVSKELKLIQSKKPKDIKEQIRIDISKLRYLIVVHTNIGASIYSRKLGDWYIDSDIIGGFLTAIQNFSVEIKKKRIPIESLKYHDFEILIEQGRYIIAALFVDGKESDWLREKVKLFVEEFEKNHFETLKHWKGELSSFRDSSYIIDKVFELYRVQEI